MAILRTNYRLSGREIDFYAIGGGVRHWYQGSAISDRRFGGFVADSFASQLSGIGFLQISAFGVMANYYGPTLVSGVWGSGYKYIPFAFQPASNLDSGAIFLNVTATHGLAVANDSTVIILVRYMSYVTGTLQALTLASNRSVHFIHSGFIVSGPDA